MLGRWISLRPKNSTIRIFYRPFANNSYRKAEEILARGCKRFVDSDSILVTSEVV